MGAEAVITLKHGVVIKHRLKKSYRHPDIDLRLRKSRTIRESRILKKMSGYAPKLLSVDKENMKLELEYIDGKKLSESLQSMDFISVCKEIGKTISYMHSIDVIHGDLTTSNMIYKEKLYIIDFGLSFISSRLEDKAVDLHLLRTAFESRHHMISEKCFDAVLSAYEHKDVLKRLKVVESRGRNKHKHP